jgi:hypothetical protein
MEMKWEHHPTREHPERYHLNCTITEDKHVFEASVIRRDQGYEVYIPEHRAGAPLILSYESLERVNRFLQLLNLPPLRQ